MATQLARKRVLFRFGFLAVSIQFAAALSGCSPSTPSRNDLKHPDGPLPSVSPSSRPAIDESHSRDKYSRLGLPARDKKWSGDDMLRAQKALASLAKDGYRSLPRYEDVESGEVFARLISPENLELFRSKDVALESRLAQAFIYYEASNQIIDVYRAAFVQKAASETELVELVGAQIRSTARILELIDEILSARKEGDPNREIHEQSLELVKRGLGKIVSGSLELLALRERFRHGELARLLACMQESFPLIVPHLSLKARIETMMRLDELLETPAMKDPRPSLQDLQMKVKQTTERKKVHSHERRCDFHESFAIEMIAHALIPEMW